MSWPEPTDAGAGDPGLALAETVVRGLCEVGVTEVVVCAGARNAALVAVLAATQSLRLWSFPEERCAGFYALGRSLALTAPVAVVTTSGTAVAELMPAVIEAHYQAVPLVVVTADRPPEYRGSGAPQAIEQVGLFAGYVAFCLDVAGTAQFAEAARLISEWNHLGPIHWNICLPEPSADGMARARSAGSAAAPQNPDPQRASTQLASDFLDETGAGPLVVVVAALPLGERPAVVRFLRRLACPVIAEATSGLRELPELRPQHVFAGEANLARLPAGRVMRIGGVPSSRWWRDLEGKPSINVLSLTNAGFAGLARPSTVAGFPAWDDVVTTPQSGCNFPWQEAEAERVAASIAGVRHSYPRGEPALVHSLSEQIPKGSLVFLGNSLPIREWNVWATTAPRGLRCHANRGANGIDGCVSTFLGLAADEDESWAVVGDLTALYDLAALWITPSLPPGRRRRVVVINNAGGRIFSRVPALQRMDDASRRMMENPHALEFGPWADLFGWSHARARTPEDIALAARRREPNLILEIIPDPAETEAIWSAVSTIHY